MVIRPFSLRSRILLLVLAVGLVPLGLIGWWMSRATARSGEELLRARLIETLNRTVSDIGGRWIAVRSRMLALAEHPDVVRALNERGEPSGPPASVSEAVSGMASFTAVAELRDTSGRAVWKIQPAERGADEDHAVSNLPLPVHFGVYDPKTGGILGRLVVHVRLEALTPARGNSAFVGGVVVALSEPETRVSLLSTPFDPTLLDNRQFQWAGEQWIVERRELAEPRVDLAAAAPLDQFTAPFKSAANRGVVVLFATTAVALLVAAGLTARMTNRLSQLAVAAEGVASGDLSRKTGLSGDDEVGRVGQTFDQMTESLGRLMQQQSQREALAAVGTFASELAHEVRNPLTSIRLDLQHVEERLPDDSPLRAVQRGALEEIQRLDGTVAGVLRLARSGRIERREIDLRRPLRSAERAATPQYNARSATLRVALPEEPIEMLGDETALQVVFLNLMLNAAQALDAGRSSTVVTERSDGKVIVRIEDEGHGMEPEQLAKIREPFFTTRADGTGLGLAIVDRIVRAHGGDLEIRSEPGSGTVVSVVLPAPFSLR